MKEIEVVKKTKPLDISFQFRWYDLWIGLYIHVEDLTLYFCPIPMCVITVSLPKKITEIVDYEEQDQWDEQWDELRDDRL